MQLKSNNFVIGCFFSKIQKGSNVGDVIGSEVVGDALSEYDRFIIRKKGLEVLMLNQSWTTI